MKSTFASKLNCPWDILYWRTALPHMHINPSIGHSAGPAVAMPGEAWS